MASYQPMFVRQGKMMEPKTSPSGCSFRISFLAREVNMSPMSKGRAEAVESTTTGQELRSERRLKVRHRMATVSENVALAFVDALRDILHDETRLAG
jgi:hypothetical protein